MTTTTTTQLDSAPLSAAGTKHPEAWIPSAIPENREFKKWKFIFFCQTHALSRSFDIFVVTYRVTNFLPKLVDMLLFSMEKTEFPFLVFPYFRVMPYPPPQLCSPLKPVPYCINSVSVLLLFCKCSSFCQLSGVVWITCSGDSKPLLDTDQGWVCPSSALYTQYYQNCKIGPPGPVSS